jgi:hypothetical protein
MARSPSGSNSDAEGLVGTAGGVFWLLASALVSFSSSLYGIINGVTSHAATATAYCSYIPISLALYFKHYTNSVSETKNQNAGTM